MRATGARAALLAAAMVALATAGSALAHDTGRGIDPNQGRSLVEVQLDSKADAIECSSRPRTTASTSTSTMCGTMGMVTVTVTVFGSAEELDARS